MKNIFYRLFNRLRTYYWRKGLLLLKFLGANIDNSCKVFGPITWIGYPKNLTLGKEVSLNANVHLNLRDKIIIGDNVHISSGVQLHTGKLVLTIPREHIAA